MDLSELDSVKACNDGADLNLYHPGTGEPLDIIIRCAGPDSDAFNRANRKMQDKRLHQSMKGGKRRMSSEDLDEDTIELLAACTLSWNEHMVVDGERVEFSLDNARMIYRRFPWIREQVNRFVGDRSNFFRGSDSGA